MSGDIVGMPLTVGAARNLLMYSRESNDRVLGLWGQEQEIINWAEANGYEIVGYARDNNVRNNIPVTERQGFTTALDTIQRHNIAGIIVDRLDRIARNVDVMLDAVQRIWDTGRDLYVCKRFVAGQIVGGIIPRGNRGLQICRAEAKRAAEELESVVSRLQAARRRKASHGGYIGGILERPYGMDRVELQGRIEHRPNPIEQAVLARIRAECADGTGYRRMARALNAEGIPTVTGVPWTHTVVRTLSLRPPTGLAVVAGPPTLSQQGAIEQRRWRA